MYDKATISSLKHLKKMNQNYQKTMRDVLCYRDSTEVSVLITCRSGPDMLEGSSGQSPTATQVMIQGPNPETVPSPIVQQAPCSKQIYPLWDD